MVNLGVLFVIVFVLFKRIVLILCVVFKCLLFLNKILNFVVWFDFVIMEVGVVKFNVYGYVIINMVISFFKVGVNLLGVI